MVFPDTLTNIESAAFDDCNGLTTVTIPSHVTSIGKGAFGGCLRLAAINVDEANPAYRSVDGILFNKDGTTLLQWPTIRGGSYAIPRSVTAIGRTAFAYCGGLTSVSIPEGVTNVGYAAFMSCTSLSSLTIPSAVNDIPDYAFYSCLGLTNLALPDAATNIGFYALTGCSGLTRLRLPGSLVTVKENAFYACEGLTNLTIPANVTFLGSEAFAMCEHLEHLFFQGNAPSLGSYVFEWQRPTIYYLPGTSGWGDTFGSCPSCPTTLWNPLLRPCESPSHGRTNGFSFDIVGTADIPVLVEVCTNLVLGNWEPVQTLSVTNGSVPFHDPATRNDPVRFYRVRSP